MALLSARPQGTRIAPRPAAVGRAVGRAGGSAVRRAVGRASGSAVSSAGQLAPACPGGSHDSEQQHEGENHVDHAKVCTVRNINFGSKQSRR